MSTTQLTQITQILSTTLMYLLTYCNRQFIMDIKLQFEYNMTKNYPQNSILIQYEEIKYF